MILVSFKRVNHGVLFNSESFKEKNEQKDGEQDKDYMTRLEKMAKAQAAMEFDWSIGL